MSGKLIDGVKIDVAESAINEELQKLKTELVVEKELEKIKNKVESIHIFSEINILNKAMNLAYHQLLGDAKNINKEVERYRKVDEYQIQRIANKMFRSENSSTIYYKAKK